MAGAFVEAEHINQANAEILEKLINSRVELTDIRPANDVIPALNSSTVLHAGPPLSCEHCCGPLRGALHGALIYEGIATSEDMADVMLREHQVEIMSAHSHGALGPMTGVISRSMPVAVLNNITYGNAAYVTLNEGLGKVLRFGAFDETVLKRLRWIEAILGPVLSAALKLRGPVSMTDIITRAVRRGDECHNRNKAATSLLIRTLAPWIVRTSFSRDDIAEVLSFLDGNDHFFLNLSMGCSKATTDAAAAVPGGSVVTCMASNGRHFGLKLSGQNWIHGAAGFVDGNYFDGFAADDANPVIGDSFISETVGLGGVAMAAAPGITRFIGGTVDDAVQATLRMYDITLIEHPRYLIPCLGFRGTPLGIDARLVVKKNLPPILNAGIAHHQAGVGQIGAGRYQPPMECFKDAVDAVSQVESEE